MSSRVKSKKKKSFLRNYTFLALIVLGSASLGFILRPTILSSHGQSNKSFDTFEAKPPFHVRKHQTNTPVGLTPQQIYSIYNLTGTGGSGTIAIVDAYDAPTAHSDLNTFSAAFGLPTLPACTTTTQTACFEKYKMIPNVHTNSNWAVEASLDTQWAHAIAPQARILLVEARSAKAADLLNAVKYAASRSDVVAISMSWGGAEFSTQTSLNSTFTSAYGATFFASTGDIGSGAEWPASAPNVTAVGGTTLNFVNNQFSSETAWSGSGGGISQYETQPSYQLSYGIPLANGKRSVPDVSFNGDPISGVAVYDSTPYQSAKGWFQVGGTSVGAPAWAAIRSIGGVNVNNATLYQDASNTNTYQQKFRDIVSGTNGTCGVICTASANYDFVTGLGSPLTTSY